MNKVAVFVVLVKARDDARCECLNVFVVAVESATTRRLDRPERERMVCKRIVMMKFFFVKQRRSMQKQQCRNLKIA